jgi:signal transduction histidine kinase
MDFRSSLPLQSSSVLILTDHTEFARLLANCWRAERRSPKLTVVGSRAGQPPDPEAYDLFVVGPVQDGNVSGILGALARAAAVILCAPSDSREIPQVRSRYPHLLYVPLRDEWPQTLVLVASESLRRVAALREALHAVSRVAQSERDAMLGRYMLEMKHTVNNALTSILGNAELLLLEPGQLSAQSLQQVRTVHQMSLRIHEVMQRFSSLASEIREAETSSQPETTETVFNAHSRR